MVEACANAYNVDRVAVVAVRSGDIVAFDVLVDRYHRALLSHLTYRTGDPELAADLTQDAFFHAFHRLDQLEDGRSFAAWLYGIAHNRLRAEWRRRRLRQFVSLDWLPDAAASVLPALRQEDGSAACQDRDLLQRVLDGLSPSLREALLLHGVDGFTAPEVARVLGISPSAAEQRICRAKAEFRRRHRVMDGE
jgi:RNA polymerase sigma-70 factor (ECF subfamily)